MDVCNKNRWVIIDDHSHISYQIVGSFTVNLNFDYSLQTTNFVCSFFPQQVIIIMHVGDDHHLVLITTTFTNGSPEGNAKSIYRGTHSATYITNPP